MTNEQIEGYAVGLEDISTRELQIGFRAALRRWEYATLPPPKFIRECIAATLEEERVSDAIVQRRKEHTYMDERLTEDEAWDDWMETKRLERETRLKLGIVTEEKRAELRKVFRDDLVLATNERLQELERQKKIILERGEGK